MGKMNKRNTPNGIIEMCLIFAFRLVFESTILTDEECEELHQMIGNHRNIYPTEWKILYRGSRDGYKMNDCHPKCYNHSNVVLIVESEQGNVFGGFTQTGWNLSAEFGEYRSYPNAFLFLIRAESHNNQHGIFRIKDRYHDKALCHYTASYCPCLFTFGNCGEDLCIMKDCNLNDENHSLVTFFECNNEYALNGEESICVQELEFYQLVGSTNMH